jgi:general secretion pathway protein D
MGIFRKKILHLALLSFVVIVFGAVPARADSVVSIQPSVSIPGVGETFDVLVEISSLSDLYAFQFDISFDPAILSAIDVTEGSFLPGGGFTFFIPGSIDNIGGSISFTADILLTAVSGVSGSGTLADLQFQALTVGTSPVNLSNVILLDSNLSDIPYNTSNGSVSPVPEPSTMLLLGSGLIGLAGYGRKKFFKK